MAVARPKDGGSNPRAGSIFWRRFHLARYIESVCRLCRRENMKLYLKGERCYSDKCAFERRGYPPGQHGQGRAKFSSYGVQLREKQKVKRMYGLLEGQFHIFFARAERKKGITLSSPGSGRYRMWSILRSKRERIGLMRQPG